MYSLMCKDREVCRINIKDGFAEILEPDLMPFTLFLKENTEVLQERLSNINSFNAWCASRVLSLDRRYAKKILNELGLTQSQDQNTKAKVARLYRCVSLQDAYWLKKENEQICWKDINLFNNSFSRALIPVALHGGSATIKNMHFNEVSHELSTQGTFAKAWDRIDNQIVLYKADEENNETLRETKASSILDCFDVSHVAYFLSEYDNKRVSVCACMTDEDWSIVQFEDFAQWCQYHGKNPIDEVKKIDKTGYHTMNVLTYLIGDTDKHGRNWGFYRNNNTGELGCIHPLFDFNYAFDGYQEPDGGWCIPEMKITYDFEDSIDYEFTSTKTQKEAALEGIRHIELKQIHPITEDMFLSEDDFEIFQNRCEILGLDLVYLQNKSLDNTIQDAQERSFLARNCKEKHFKNLNKDVLFNIGR